MERLLLDNQNNGNGLPTLDKKGSSLCGIAWHVIAELRALSGYVKR